MRAADPSPLPPADPVAGPRRRILLAAFGDPGHAFPMIALGEALVRRGHEVCLETWSRWREPAQAAGMTFAAAAEDPVFPTERDAFDPYPAAARAAQRTRGLVDSWRPDACVADVLTLGPALAAESAGVPVATLVPHLHPDVPPGAAPFALGARLPRTRVGAAGWGAAGRLVAPSLELGRCQLNAARASLGLPTLAHVHGGLSRELTLLATLPQLEYPREWPAWTRITGPLLWEPPGAPDVQLPAGNGPVVLVAPSTSQDPDGRLLRAALEGLAGARVRVVAAGADPAAGHAPDVPANAVRVPWLSYAKAMPRCDLVVCHGGHGTVARALTCGRPVLVCPAGGDMAENAARVDWAGVGVRLPRRLLGPRALRLAVERALSAPGLAERAASTARWAATQQPADRASAELERWLSRRTGKGE